MPQCSHKAPAETTVSILQLSGCCVMKSWLVVSPGQPASEMRIEVNVLCILFCVLAFGLMR